MAATLNLHKLFDTNTGYLGELRVSPEDQETLSVAREAIRTTLRGAFRDWEKVVRRTELFDSLIAKASAELDLPQPKFRIQGSFAYHTANDCQFTPPQQIDQDDGVFLPVGFVSVDNTVRPGIASRAYFTIVETALGPLCAAKGWTLNPVKKNDNCVRVEINSRLHIDLPLYVIRDDAYEALVESEARVLEKSLAQDHAHTASVLRSSIELSDSVYFSLEDSEIALAHRTKGWISSDPRKLEVWFKEAVDLYGPEVRRVTRALKGLRDHSWDNSDLSSVCIQAAVVRAFGLVGTLESRRDDLTLLTVGRKVVELLKGPIENPVYPGERDKCLCQGMSSEHRAEVLKTFGEALDELERAIHDTVHKGLAISWVRSAFGERIPEDESLVSVTGVVEVIRNIEPTPQPKPMVPRTTSG